MDDIESRADAIRCWLAGVVEMTANGVDNLKIEHSGSSFRMKIVAAGNGSTWTMDVTTPDIHALSAYYQSTDWSEIMLCLHSDCRCIAGFAPAVAVNEGW